MNNVSLLRRYYKEVPANILLQYKNAEKSVWVNTGDKDLVPIEIKLPEPPEAHLIDNFGLPAEEQMWHPPKLPKRLKELQTKYETLDEIWIEIEDHPDIYEEEIKFIEQQWDRRLNGYWFYNNGVPTYIDGWNYFYWSWWYVRKGLPEDRERDRLFFLFARKIYTETKSPKCNAEGKAIRDDKGNYEWIEHNRRVFYGFIYPKHRREGATTKAECVNYEIISRTQKGHGGIQSMNDVKAGECFRDHLVRPWKKLPFFFKPNYEGSTDPKNELSFNPPAKRLSSKGSLSKSEIGLEALIDFGDADETAYEGLALDFHHDDEIGRLKKGASCIIRHRIVKECLVEGDEIFGFTIKTSTVGEMERGGGKQFKQLCKDSNYYERDLNGQTGTGLAVLFIPADFCLKGFVDKYGQPVSGTPTKKQAEYIGKREGATEYLKNRRKKHILSGDMIALSDEERLYPIHYRECFRTAQKESGFNMGKLEGYIDELSFGKQDIAVGDFVWKNNIRDSEVIFVAKPNGKFKLSHQLNSDEANKKVWSDDEMRWKPGNAYWGVAGGDPFKFNKTEGNRKSKGGGAVIRKAKIKDGDFSMKRKFVCIYAQRTFDKNVYGEDMLMMCLYYGVPMFPEIDYPFLWDYFEERGYGGFLLYKIDPHTFRLNNTPGETANKVKQDIFTEYMTWIENEADIETHIEVLEECRDIDGPEDMTNYDLFTAGGYALLGTRGIYDEIQALNEKEYQLDDYYKKRTYSNY